MSSRPLHLCWKCLDRICRATVSLQPRDCECHPRRPSASLRSRIPSLASTSVPVHSQSNARQKVPEKFADGLPLGDSGACQLLRRTWSLSVLFSCKFGLVVVGQVGRVGDSAASRGTAGLASRASGSTILGAPAGIRQPPSSLPIHKKRCADCKPASRGARSGQRASLLNHAGLGVPLRIVNESPAAAAAAAAAGRSSSMNIVRELARAPTPCAPIGWLPPPSGLARSAGEALRRCSHLSPAFRANFRRHTPCGMPFGPSPLCVVHAPPCTRAQQRQAITKPSPQAPVVLNVKRFIPQLHFPARP